jgi:ATP-binding cassette subfamily B protein RaxB
MRREIGSVMQTDTLFAGSIADNISFFAAKADQRRIERCAMLAAIHDEIIAMPMAYNTLIGFMGGALSAGQQQRILLARALYKNPKILLLDEATSHLDVERERMIDAGLRKLDLTRVIVAHRPQTITAADRIVTVARGCISSDAPLAAKLQALTRRTLGPPADGGAA